MTATRHKMRLREVRDDQKPILDHSRCHVIRRMPRNGIFSTVSRSNCAIDGTEAAESAGVDPLFNSIKLLLHLLKSMEDQDMRFLRINSDRAIVVMNFGFDLRVGIFVDCHQIRLERNVCRTIETAVLTLGRDDFLRS